MLESLSNRASWEEAGDKGHAVEEDVETICTAFPFLCCAEEISFPYHTTDACHEISAIRILEFFFLVMFFTIAVMCPIVKIISSFSIHADLKNVLYYTMTGQKSISVPPIYISYISCTQKNSTGSQ